MLSGSIHTNPIKDNAQNSSYTHDISLSSTRCDVDFTDMVAGADNLNILDLNYTESRSYRMLGDEDLDIRPRSIRNHNCIQIHYQLIENSILPYLRFKLYKHKGILDFETFDITHGDIPVVENETYCGLYEHDHIQYLFYKTDIVKQEVAQITNQDTFYWLTVDDIINLKHYFHMDVVERVSFFFTLHPKFIRVVDENEAIMETPTTAYRGDYYKKVSLFAGMGMRRADTYASLGPYYYFGSYKRSLRYAAVTMNGKPLVINGIEITVGDTPVYTQGGMVKYALFMGNTKVLLNLKTDPEDDSYESKVLASKRNFIKDTLKLRDTNGKWTTEYNSVIQPQLTLYDRDLKSSRTLEPQYVIKQFEQQIVTEYAYYDTKHITKNNKTGFYNVDEIKMQ